MTVFPTIANVMKRTLYYFTLGIATVTFLAAYARGENWMAGMEQGKPSFKSMTQLAFGPEGILFIADTRSAAIVAIATDDIKEPRVTEALKIENILQKLASLLGTSADQILIDDMAVNPVSH